MNRKAFTMLEIIAVLVMVGVLMVILVPRLSSYSYNSKIDTVEAELRTFALDINNYVVDYGEITMSIEDSKISETVYTDWIDEFIGSLNELYLGSTLDITSLEIHTLLKTDSLLSDDIYDYFKIKTMYKKDPWGNPYVLTFHTREAGTDDTNKILGHGIVIVQSYGPDQTDESEFYATREFGEDKNGVERIDDIILIIQTSK